LSNVATTYAKRLVIAPDGSSLKAAEKAVLMVLAEWHNSELGCAFPAMRSLADCCCISERYCRQLIQGLEQKRVIRRVFYRRECDRSQTSNEYIFLALKGPGDAAKTAEARRRFQRIARVPISGGAGTGTPPSHERRDRARGTKSTVPPGTQVPPIEPLGEPLGDSALNVLLGPFPPTPQDVARTMDGAKPFPIERSRTVLCDGTLARMAWDAVMQDLSKALLPLSPWALENRPGFTNGSKDWRSFRFNEVAAESAEMNAQGAVVVTLSSPNPKATARGLEKYQRRIALTLSKFYGCNAVLRLQGRELSAAGTAQAATVGTIHKPIEQ
jgi:hypothetical protein